MLFVIASVGTSREENAPIRCQYRLNTHRYLVLTISISFCWNFTNFSEADSMYGKRDGCGLWVPSRGSWVPSRRSFCTDYWYYYNYRFTSVVASLYGRFGRDVHKHEDSFSVQFQNIGSARRGLLFRFQFWNLTPRQSKFSSILQPYTGLNTKNPSCVTVSPAKMKSWGMGSELLYTLQLTSKKNNKQPRRVSKKEDKRVT